jgi:uncharacterized repeat protein (TIGR03803 family)
MNSISKMTMALAVATTLPTAAIASQSLPALLITRTLYSFCSQTDCTDGGFPESELLQAADGKLYGTTMQGGATNYGTVFNITPAGMLTTLYSFDDTPGAYPFAGLIQATDGDFYGTTQGSGVNGYGSVFKMTARGNLTTMMDFDFSDGGTPLAALVQGADGDLYGTTQQGGSPPDGGEGDGTIFKITLNGAQTVLHGFCYSRDSNGYCSDGAFPAGLMLASDGNFYGTTQTGGANNQGTVFQMTSAGAVTTLYSFCSQTNCSDGAEPLAPLVQGIDGAFYGTTFLGGASGYGAVFKISSGGTLTTLHSFANKDGANPYAAALVQATDGNFYGTTEEGGAYHAGTVFEITPAGTLTRLHSFCSENNCPDGANPIGALVQSTDGALYGTTLNGGAHGAGTVFSLSKGLGQFVETQAASGNVGTIVGILGTNLTGATSVTFNGASATFTVNSTGTAIAAKVPTGATTGMVTVTTPNGVLSSNRPFIVRE